jgi:hypothetical protein
MVAYKKYPAVIKCLFVDIGKLKESGTYKFITFNEI